MRSNVANLPRYEFAQLATYAWPGGYPLYYMDSGFSVLCALCARLTDEDPEVEEYITTADVNWEDPDLDCDLCYARIESAYAEED